MGLKPPPDRTTWRKALSHAAVQLAQGLDGHHVRLHETWDTAILRVATEWLAEQGHQLSLSGITRERFDDLQLVAGVEPSSDDGRVLGPRGRRVLVPRRRGWAA